MAQNKLITINLRKYLASQPRNKRARKAMLLVREQVSRLAKVRPENIRVSQNLNSLIFKKYSKRLVPLKLNVSIDKERADVTHFGEKAEKAEKPEKTEKKESAKVERGKEAAKGAAETKK